MSFELSEKTKKIISRKVGIPYEQLLEMDDEKIEKYIEQKAGKKITWPKGAKIDGLPIRTMEDVDKKMDSLIMKDNGWDR